MRKAGTRLAALAIAVLGAAATAQAAAQAPARSEPPAPGDSRIAVWKGRAQAAVSITMDDGYASQWRYMAPLLSSRGFRGTFFVVTQWLDQEGLWGAWERVAAEGHEIGSHGLTHVALDQLDDQGLVEELEWSRARLTDRIGGSAGRVLAYPFSQASPEVVAAARRAGYVAARTGGDRTNPAAPPDLHLVCSRHPLSATSLDEMKQWVDDVRGDGGWLVIGVHGVRDPDRSWPPTQEGWEPVPLDRYARLLDALAAAGDEIWVAPFGVVAEWVRAREAASVRSRLEDGVVRVTLDGVPGEAAPALSLVTGVPAGWRRARVETAGGPVQVLPVTVEAGRATILYEASPPASIRISPAGAEPGPRR